MYTFETKVRYSEVDESLKLTLPALTKYFQDTCIFDSEKGEVNMEYLTNRNLSWVLSAWQITIERLPKMNEKISVYTVPYEFKGFIGYRNFEVKDGAGNSMVKADSVWTLIDTEKVKPFRPDEEILSGYDMGEKIDMEYTSRKIVIEGDAQKGNEHFVYKSQIDSNHHLNNSEYINLAYEYLPEQVRVTKMRVEYKTAAYLGDIIIPVIYKQEGKMQVQLNNTDMNPYAVVELAYE